MRLDPATQKAMAALGRLTDITVMPLGRPRKYRSTPTELDGIKFDSKAEANRYAQLKLMVRAALISDLQLQVKFQLLPEQHLNGHREKAVFYIADFAYRRQGELVVEDVKSAPTKTKEYILKRKLMLFIHGIIVQEYIPNAR